MFENLNRKKTVMEHVDTDGMEWKKLKDFKGTEIPVKGYFFTINSFTGAKQVTVVSENDLINMPQRAVFQFEEIYDDDEMNNAVLEGRLKVVVGDEIKTRKGSTIEYTLAEITK